MTAEDKRVCGLEQALSAAEGLAGGMLQLLVQIEIVLALAAVAALVTVEGPLPGVHAHMLDELVGRLRQVAALVTLVVVAQAMLAGVRLQLQLVGLHRLADPALVLHLVVGLEVALHGSRAVGGINAEWAPFSGFSSLFSEGWLPGTTEMTSKLSPPLFFWELSESSLPLAESLRVDSEDEEGLFDSLGVFLSSPVCLVPMWFFISASSIVTKSQAVQQMENIHCSLSTWSDMWLTNWTLSSVSNPHTWQL